MLRDGQQALVSRQKSSVVLVRPGLREIARGGRPVFIVGIINLGKQPTNFLVNDVSVIQNIDGREHPMQVITFEALAREEKQRQIAAAILVGVAGAANSFSAAQAGHGTYENHRGQQRSFYSPVANAIAQNRAAAQNETMIAATIEQGQVNMLSLEQNVIKDNTLLPGEWVGGQLHLSAPATPASGAVRKSYTMTMMVGAERHVINVQQAPAGN